MGCCGAPWLTAGDTRRFAAQASRNVATLAAAIRAGTDVVVAQPTCHAVITTDYVDHVGGSDAELVAGRTFDALRYLADHVARSARRWVPRSDWPSEPDRDRRGDGTAVDAPMRIVHHEPCPAPRRRVPVGGPAAARDDRRNGRRRAPQHGRRRQMGAARRQRADRPGHRPRARSRDRTIGRRRGLRELCAHQQRPSPSRPGARWSIRFELLAGSADFARRRGRRRGGGGDAA